MKPLRLVFMGTPAYAVPALDALCASGHSIAAVYTQPPRPAQRGRKVRPAPVAVRAEAARIEVRTPPSLKPAAVQAAFAALEADLAVTVAYGLILPPAVLAAPRLGCINAHASLLPRWRGAAPIQRAIIAGDSESGVTIMRMDEGLDTGPILTAETVPIGPETTGGSLHDTLAELSARLIVGRGRRFRGGHADRDAAAGGRCDLHGQIEEARSCHRLARAGSAHRAHGARARAVPRRLVQPRRRAHQAIGRCGGRPGRGRTAWYRSRRDAHHCLRRRFGASPAPPSARRQGADGDRRLPPRTADRGRHAAAMPRYKLTLEYDGTGFVGWQYQGDGRSVQEALERAVERFCGEQVRVHGAGRTDSGVHALGQCCHLDLAKQAAPAVLRDALNAHLRPAPVTVLEAAEASADFDARRDATARIYLYRIVNRKAPLALARKRAWQLPRPLDSGSMARAARLLQGTHDFTTFRAAQCQADSPVRTLQSLAVSRSGEEIAIRAWARSFLHHQVRAMVGTLVEVGEGRRTPGDVGAALAARDRRRSGPTAPAWGLYLEAVIYPPPRR